MSDTGAFRLGFLSHVEGGSDLAESYRNALELFVAADELGFDSGWVAQHHFGPGEADGLASPWIFLASAAARTRRIHIGTAVTLIPLHHPVQLAQDVGVLDAISGGRVELGVGTGFDKTAYGVFGEDFDRRRELTTERFAQVRAALRGEPLDADGTVLKASSPDLADNRSWHAVFSAEGAAHVAGEGANLLLNRATYGYEEPTDVVQRAWAERYLAEWSGSRPPRIGLSRLIFAADDRRTALAQIGDALVDNVRRSNAGGRPLGPETLENALFRYHAHYGHPDEVIAQLQSERVLPLATDLLAQFNPGRPGLDASIRALELLATEIAPALGWRPAHERLTQQAASAAA
ncbi:LLM class flavin-dependent oxidoreductase [Microbacterium sp. CFBP9034]|uniref:LLM class flavin-dependent oxidoreductase n=1 Tax=Microbacterium sp. CFBP9034 TaxID=3096540 RepID=UPI002A69E1E1|nr:LLM class flavin-dependent oxidoreductase [Microbacterium sp. CFBP9034]MDY0910209.1 LLM class flavin-dependent oxidoreductase [Microbacterium sp. CFBP9034]